MTKIEDKRFWIWFAMVKDLGSIKKQRLLKIYKNPEKIYRLSKEQLLKVDGIGEITAVNIVDERVKSQVDEQIKKMKELNINIISVNESSYPKQLKEIYDCPISLFVKGNVENLKKPSIAVIGCRQASEYGKKAAKYFGYYLAQSGFNVVSGLARGIDSYAHIGNINMKEEYMYNKSKLKAVDKLSTSEEFSNKNILKIYGNPVAVIGNGMDIIYPKENEKLEEEILNVGGTIITEYPLGTTPNKTNFPARNRIISGLSKGVLVIEAKRKSGTLLTVDFALEQGREVFVMPGNINSPNSLGTNDLIKQGARIVTSYKDVLEAL